MMKIREANEEDDEVLVELEKKCPMGTSLVLSHDSSPDYFANYRAFWVPKNQADAHFLAYREQIQLFTEDSMISGGQFSLFILVF